MDSTAQAIIDRAEQSLESQGIIADVTYKNPLIPNWVNDVTRLNAQNLNKIFSSIKSYTDSLAERSKQEESEVIVQLTEYVADNVDDLRGSNEWLGSLAMQAADYNDPATRSSLLTAAVATFTQSESLPQGRAPRKGDQITITPASGSTAPEFPAIWMFYVENTSSSGQWKFFSSLKPIEYASANSPGIVQISSGINLASDGVISVPKATTSTAGSVIVGSGINLNTSTGTISVPVSSGTTKGIVSAGSNITNTDGVLSVPVTSTTGLGVVQIGSGLDVTSAGVLSATDNSLNLGRFQTTSNLTSSSATFDITSDTTYPSNAAVNKFLHNNMFLNSGNYENLLLKICIPSDGSAWRVADGSEFVSSIRLDSLTYKITLNAIQFEDYELQGVWGNLSGYVLFNPGSSALPVDFQYSVETTQNRVNMIKIRAHSFDTYTTVDPSHVYNPNSDIYIHILTTLKQTWF